MALGRLPAMASGRRSLCVPAMPCWRPDAWPLERTRGRCSPTRRGRHLSPVPRRQAIRRAGWSARASLESPRLPPWAPRSRPALIGSRLRQPPSMRCACERHYHGPFAGRSLTPAYPRVLARRGRLRQGAETATTLVHSRADVQRMSDGCRVFICVTYRNLPCEQRFRVGTSVVPPAHGWRCRPVAAMTGGQTGAVVISSGSARRRGRSSSSPSPPGDIGP